MCMCVCAFLPVVLNGEHEKSLAASRQSEQLFSLFESAASVMNCLRVEEMVVEEKGGLRDGRRVSLSQKIRNTEMYAIQCGHKMSVEIGIGSLLLLYSRSC